MKTKIQSIFIIVLVALTSFLIYQNETQKHEIKQIKEYITNKDYCAFTWKVPCK